MVVVSISEVYDLSTVKDKMTMIGIHTPKKELIQKTYPGLCMNSKYFRIVKTDVVLTAVSGTVAVTPDMVGADATQIAPEDLLNPILYKAVSNDSWNTLEYRLAGLREQTLLSTNYASVPLVGNQAFAENDDVTGLNDEFGVYYSLLSNRDGFKIAPIQHGLEMRGLVPLVFEQYYDVGVNSSTPLTYPVEVENNQDAQVLNNVSYRSMRGRAHPMPRINTTYLTSVSGTTGQPGQDVSNGMGDGTPRNVQAQMPNLVPLMLGCIIMPPCRKTKLFFRMTVRTFISFEEVRPIQEVTSFSQMDTNYSSLVYHSDYNTQSSKMDATTDMVDVQNAEIQKVMEGR